MALEAGKIQKWKTKLQPISDDNCSDVELVTISLYSTWMVTDFGRDLKGKFIYVIQPVVNQGGDEGVTGMSVFCLTEEELVKYFELKIGDSQNG